MASGGSPAVQRDDDAGWVSSSHKSFTVNYYPCLLCAMNNTTNGSPLCQASHHPAEEGLQRKQKLCGSNNGKEIHFASKCNGRRKRSRGSGSGQEEDNNLIRCIFLDPIIQRLAFQGAEEGSEWQTFILPSTSDSHSFHCCSSILVRFWLCFRYVWKKKKGTGRKAT